MADILTHSVFQRFVGYDVRDPVESSLTPPQFRSEPEPDEYSLETWQRWARQWEDEAGRMKGLWKLAQKENIALIDHVRDLSLLLAERRTRVQVKRRKRFWIF